MGESIIIELIKSIAPEGVFAMLFIALFFYTMFRQDKRELKLEANEKALMEKQEAREKDLVEKHEKREERLMLFLESTNNGHEKLMSSQAGVVDGLKELAVNQKDTVNCIKQLEFEIKLVGSKVNGNKRRLSNK